jgi:site-specific DNA-methyltransferase (adenine-specific)
MRTHEDVLIFSFGTKMPDYRPQMTPREIPIKIGGSMKTSEAIPIVGRADFKGKAYTEAFPISILPFSNRDRDRGYHPTQKPVELLSYLIRTYTDKGMTVLDNCMGSGSTGVACVNTERNFIGIEKDEGYFKIAERRIEDAKAGRLLLDLDD